MKQPILLFPHKALRTPAKPVTEFGPELEKLAKSLHQLTHKQKAGIGIAAPQVGILRQIAIVDVSSRVPGAQPLFLVNPRILETSEPFIRKEGCMSLPEYTGYVQRFNRVRLEWQDIQGRHHEKIFQELEAVCIQHEVDHLHGKLFLDHITCLKSNLIPQK